jgi:hypothetical protein
MFYNSAMQMISEAQTPKVPHKFNFAKNTHAACSKQEDKASPNLGLQTKFPLVPS